MRERTVEHTLVQSKPLNRNVVEYQIHESEIAVGLEQYRWHNSFIWSFDICNLLIQQGILHFHQSQILKCIIIHRCRRNSCNNSVWEKHDPRRHLLRDIWHWCAPDKPDHFPQVLTQVVIWQNVSKIRLCISCLTITCSLTIYKVGWDSRKKCEKRKLLLLTASHVAYISNKEQFPPISKLLV